MKKYLPRAPIRILALTVIFAMMASLLPAIPQEASAATTATNLQNPRIADNGTVTWDCVWFGNYPQSPDGKGGFNNEPIKWRVLSVDGDEALLLADKNLDAKQYNKTYTSVTWETSTIRSWLNGYDADRNKHGEDYTSDNFINKAFDFGERAAINRGIIKNPNNPQYGTNCGNDTTDKVFLLSIEEVTNSDYGFPSDYKMSSETRRALNTDYARSQGTENADNGYWWLRSLGHNSYEAAFVNIPAYVWSHGYYVNSVDGAVRPALFLDLKSDCWFHAGTVSSDGTINGEESDSANQDEHYEYNGHKYKIFTGKDYSWDQAQEYCVSLGGHLATVTSKEENDFLASIIKGSAWKNMWIGAEKKDEAFQWVTGEAWDYTNWAKGEPNNLYNIQNAAMMYTASGTWNDEGKNGRDWNGYRLNETGFICEWEPVEDVKSHNYPVMEERDAKAFWGFLFNIPQDFRTDEFFEKDILEDPIYKLLTGQYAPGSLEEESARRAFMVILDKQLVTLTNGATKAQHFLRENLIKCLNKEIGTDPDATEMKGECQEIFDNIRKPFQEKLEDSLASFVVSGCGKNLSEETIANVRCGMDIGADILALPDKIDTFVNRVEMGVSAAFLSMNSELAGRYQYFATYLDHRKSASGPDDLVFQTTMEYNKLALSDDTWIGGFTTLIPGKSSWSECTDLIERWAENTYLILEDEYAGAHQEPTTEPSEPNTEPTTEASQPNIESDPGSSSKPSVESNRKPSAESGSKPADEESGTEPSEKQASGQTITAKSYTKTVGDKAFNLGAKAKTTLTYQSSDKNVATVDKKGLVTIKGPGRATIAIKAAATNQYKAAEKKVTITVKPKQPSLTKASAGKKGTLKLIWKKDTKATGYQAMVATDKKFKKNKKTATIKKNKTVTKTFAKLKSKKAYYAKVRAYKQVGKTKVYGSYSKVKKAKVK